MILQSCKKSYNNETQRAVSPEDTGTGGIRPTMDTLRQSGLSGVILVNLTREEIGVPVVRLIVPGPEVYTMDPERTGPRCLEARKHTRSREG